MKKRYLNSIAEYYCLQILHCHGTWRVTKRWRRRENEEKRHSRDSFTVLRRQNCYKQLFFYHFIFWISSHEQWTRKRTSHNKPLTMSKRHWRTQTLQVCSFLETLAMLFIFLGEALYVLSQHSCGVWSLLVSCREKNMEKIEGAINTIHTNVAHVCENMTKNLEATKKVMETMNSLMETFVIHNILVRMRLALILWFVGTTLTQKSKEIVGMDIIVSNLTSFALKDLVLRLCDTHGSTFVCSEEDCLLLGQHGNNSRESNITVYR